MTNSEKTKGTLGVVVLSLAICSWIALILVGTFRLLSFEYNPGSDSNFPLSWPQLTELELNSNSYNLIMALHPKCSCSRASLDELSKLVAKFPNQIQATVLFVAPKYASQDWHDNENLTLAHLIPGVKTIEDIDGHIAQSFNAKTSGLTLLYDSKGQLLFSGGITAARGHSGDNLGSQTITDLISGKLSSVKSTAVFGCTLFNK